MYNLQLHFGSYNDDTYDFVTNPVSGLNGKRVYNENTGEVFIIRVSEYESPYKDGIFLNQAAPHEEFQRLASAYSTTLGSQFQTAVPLEGISYSVSYYYTDGLTESTIKLFTGTGVQITYELESSTEPIRLTIPLSNSRIKCQDQPFDIFCVPYYSYADGVSEPNSAPQYNESLPEGKRLLRIDSSTVLRLFQQLPAILGSS